MYAYAALSQGSPMPPTLPTLMSREEAGAYFKELRASRKLRLQDVVDGTTVPTVQYLSALEGGRYNPLNSEHFPSLAQFYRLPREEIERIRPGTIVEVIAEPAPPPDPRTLPDGLQSAIDLYGKRFSDLLDPQWQQYMARFRWRTGQPEEPEAWLDLYRDLSRAGIVPGES